LTLFYKYLAYPDCGRKGSFLELVSSASKNPGGRGRVKKCAHLSGSVDFFWNNPLLEFQEVFVV